jgi:hypothetical protein
MDRSSCACLTGCWGRLLHVRTDRHADSVRACAMLGSSLPTPPSNYSLRQYTYLQKWELGTRGPTRSASTNPHMRSTSSKPRQHHNLLWCLC